MTKKHVIQMGAAPQRAFLKAGPIFQRPFSLPESAQTFVATACRAAGKSGNNLPAASKPAEKTVFSSFLKQ